MPKCKKSPWSMPVRLIDVGDANPDNPYAQASKDEREKALDSLVKAILRRRLLGTAEADVSPRQRPP